MEYQVRETDTIERIAAIHDCTIGELVKLNKMHSRMVFPGQRIRVPVPQDPSSPSANASTTTLTSQTSTSDGYTLVSTTSPPLSPLSPTGNNPIRPPGLAVRQTSTASYQSNTSPHRQLSVTSGHGNPDPDDTDCLRRFLKVRVKQVTESDGTVTGTLLITPNCVMFDPDLHHPLVKENGPDIYGMVANMDDIVSVSVFKHDHSLVDKTESESSERKKLSFDCGPTEDDYKVPEDIDTVFTESESGSDDSLNHVNPPLTLTMSIDPQLPSIQEESHYKSTPTPDNAPLHSMNSLDTDPVIKRRAISDAGVIPNDPETANDSHVHQQLVENSNVPDRPRAHSDLQPSTSLDSSGQPIKSGFSRFSPSMTRRSFGRLGRTLSNRANSLKGTVTSGAQTVASGTQKVAHGVVTHTKSAAGHIHAGIETGVKTVAAVPTSIVTVGSEILQEGQDLYGSLVAELKGEPPKSPVAIKREKSLATLESLRQKTHEARMTSINQNNIDAVFTKASTNDEISDLFHSIDSMSSSAINPQIIGTPPDPPYYMTIRVDRKRMTKKKRINYEDALTGNRHASVSSTSDDLSFGNRRRCEFWFAIPRTSADAIYHFLLIWSPGHHQPEESETKTSENNTSRNSLSQEPPLIAPSHNGGIGNKKGLIVLDSHSENTGIHSGGRIDDQNWFGATFGSGLIREWEIITVRELCRRLSLDQEYDLAEIPLPEGSNQSQILDEFMIRQIAEILPPRAEGYPWVLIYNSEKHGFSLATLYRKMEAWYDEMSPILLIIRDTQGHVFGAMVSTAIRPTEHYYGTADACFLFRFTGKVPHTRELRHYEWTGDNQFFINSTRDTLSIGAGQGHSGLWLDADLNHGRSQRCKTFDNEPLAGGDDEDFIIQFVEAFGFSMN